MSNFLVSYSTSAFYERHHRLNRSAVQFNVNDIFAYYDVDLLKSDFYRLNRELLDNPKGAGFWLWKPYFICEAMKQIQDGDFLLYVDAASLFIGDPAPLFDIGIKNDSGIVSFDIHPMTNGQWTKRDTFIELDSDEQRFWFSNHVIATVIGFRKTRKAIDFLDEWLFNCQNIAALSDYPNKHGKDNLEVFVDHRMDQSVLSILIERHKIETYRNPSKWGNYLKLPEFREKGEYVGYPYALNDSIRTYSSEPSRNSPYGTIFEFNVKEDSTSEIQTSPKLHEKLFSKLPSFRRPKI